MWTNVQSTEKFYVKWYSKTDKDNDEIHVYMQKIKHWAHRRRQYSFLDTEVGTRAWGREDSIQAYRWMRPITAKVLETIDANPVDNVTAIYLRRAEI